MSKTTNSAIIKNLMEFGLGQKEANVYLALLELEIATVSETAEAANVNRSSAYVVLESLKNKGLVSVSEDKNIQQYVAVSPDILLFDAQNKAQKAEDVKNNISNIVPELKALHKDTKQKPKVRVFEGKQGLINVFEDTLNNKEKLMRVAASMDNIIKILPDYLPRYSKKRIKLGIKIHGIYPQTQLAKNSSLKNYTFDKNVFVSHKKYIFPADMVIYDNKIAYVSTQKEGTSIIIESKEITNVMKSIFDLAYKEASRLNKISKLVGKYKKSLNDYKEKATTE